MKFDTIVILTAINSGFAILSKKDSDGIFFFIMSVFWFALPLIVGSKVE